MFTRNDYMATYGSDEARTEAHRKYYGQFVTADVRLFVERSIGRDRIVRSTDPHFNDIPLHLWDAMEPVINRMCLSRMGEVNGLGFGNRIVWSLSDSVCITKEAARQIKEEAS